MPGRNFYVKNSTYMYNILVKEKHKITRLSESRMLVIHKNGTAARHYTTVEIQYKTGD